MSNDDMRQLKQDLHAALIANGRSSGDAEEIVIIAAQAAREAMQRLIEVVGTAPESNRDHAIIVALNIMERLALTGHKLEKLNPYTG